METTFENLTNKLWNAKSTEEILSYKNELVQLYDEIYEKMQNGSYFIIDYDNIKMFNSMESPMTAYYGPFLYEKFGIPFLKEHRPETIDVLELSTLYYSIQVINLLESGFYSDASLCIFKDTGFPDIPDHMEKTDITNYKYEKYLFSALWFYFRQIITIKDDTREITIERENEIDTFYITDEKYEELLETMIKSYDDSNYAKIVNQILGIYRIRFTKMNYILNYQPLFVKAGYEYLCAIIKHK